MAFNPREPMPPWLEVTWQRLRDSYTRHRLGQALLLSGPLGVGKRLFAERLAGLLLCGTPLPDGSPCGVCVDCQLLAGGHHPDRVLLAPDAEAASPEIRAEQVRNLCAREHLTPTRGATKVLLMAPAEAMNAFAANSLLKTLEEPAASTVWVLISEQPRRLSQTIRSRCQQISLAAPATAQALPWLEQRLGQRLAQLPATASAKAVRSAAGSSAETAPAARCLALAQGAPFRALALAQAGALEQRYGLLQAMLGVAEGERDPIAVAADWQRLEASEVLAALTEMLIDLLRLAVDATGARLTHVADRPALLRLAARVDIAAGHRLLQRLLRARASIESSVNKQLLFESLLVRWTRLLRAGS
jgi:DNA polymerase-3 subunit delta'